MVSFAGERSEGPLVLMPSLFARPARLSCIVGPFVARDFRLGRGGIAVGGGAAQRLVLAAAVLLPKSDRPAIVRSRARCFTRSCQSHRPYFSHISHIRPVPFCASVHQLSLAACEAFCVLFPGYIPVRTRFHSFVRSSRQCVVVPFSSAGAWDGMLTFVGAGEFEPPLGGSQGGRDAGNVGGARFSRLRVVMGPSSGSGCVSLVGSRCYSSCARDLISRHGSFVLRFAVSCLLYAGS